MPEATVLPAVSASSDGGPVTGIELFEGPNLYLPHAAVVATLDLARLGHGGPQALQPAELGLLAEILLARCRATAALTLQPDSAARLGASAAQGIAATLALLCLELQRLNTTHAQGMCVIGGGAQGRARAIAFGYENVAMARAVPAAACALVDAVLRARGRLDPATFVLPPALQAFLERARALPILRSSRKILRTARKRGIPWMPVLETSDLLQLGHGCRRRLLRGSTSDSISQIGHWLTSDKRLCADFVTRLGFPAPRQVPVTSPEAAVAAAHAIGYPVVVKPLAGFNGRGITVGIARDEDMAAAFSLAAALRRGVLVESFIPGHAHRLIVVDGRLASASLFRPAGVTGDGRSDVAALVARENARPVRSQGFASGLLPIPLDAVSKGVLRNPEYGVVANNKLATKEELSQAKALWAPSVDLLGETGWERTNSPIIDDKSLWRNRASLTITQLLFDGWGVNSEIKRQKYRTESASNRVGEVAEFVGLDIVQAYLEVLRQRDLLLQMGCDDAQGYLFGKPMAAEDLASRLLR